MAKLPAEEALQRISEWLAQLYGPRLRSLVAYGSIASGNHHAGFSDVNLLCVLDRVDAATLDQGANAVRWWMEQGNPPPILLSRAELEDAADVFPIEYLDIQSHHRLVRGEDLVSALPHFPELHRLQVEHELRTQLLRLRGRYMRHNPDAKAIERLMLESVSTFLTLFRHALVATGEPILVKKDDVVAAASAHFGFDAEPFRAILAARRAASPLVRDKKQIYPLFAAYLNAIQTVERRLEEKREP